MGVDGMLAHRPLSKIEQFLFLATTTQMLSTRRYSYGGTAAVVTSMALDLAALVQRMRRNLLS